MLRIIGILIGSALAVATLIVAVGIPRFSPPDEQAAATDAVPAAEATAIAAPIEVDASSSQPAQSMEEPVEEPAGEPLSQAETEALIDEIFAPQPQAATADAVVAEDIPAEQNWYAFWSPFRSEIAANGFVSRLQETTGIDYRIVKVKTGVYEVAFAYVDDNDIQDKLQRISAATGLDVTGG